MATSAVERRAIRANTPKGKSFELRRRFTLSVNSKDVVHLEGILYPHPRDPYSDPRIISFSTTIPSWLRPAANKAAATKVTPARASDR
jgi:hypothetical protein